MLTWYRTPSLCQVPYELSLVTYSLNGPGSVLSVSCALSVPRKLQLQDYSCLHLSDEKTEAEKLTAHLRSHRRAVCLILKPASLSLAPWLFLAHSHPVRWYDDPNSSEAEIETLRS